MTPHSRLFLSRKKKKVELRRSPFQLKITAVEEPWFDSGSVLSATRSEIVASLSLLGKDSNTALFS